MFAPVALRFRSYQIELPTVAEHYKQTLLDHPAMKAWMTDAISEKEHIDEVEL
jgi:glutathione S-transferase